MRPFERGTRSEGVVLGALLKLGRTVLVPYGSTASYDLVIEENRNFVRIQVKTGWLRRGVVCFNACSQPRGGLRRSYRGLADLFAVYAPELDEVFLVPVDAVHEGSGARLRLDPPRNGQRKRIIWAEPFRLTSESGVKLSTMSRNLGPVTQLERVARS
jgi:hypothetical protein